MGRKPKGRAKMIAKFVQVAQELRALNNFNTLMAVISGLTSTPIERLKQTQTFFQTSGQIAEQEKYWQPLRELEKLMSSDHLFANYRVALDESELPCIPGLVFREMIYIEEQKDILVDGSVNVSKALMMGDVLLTLQRFQSKPHVIERDPYILSMILESTALSTEVGLPSFEKRKKKQNKIKILTYDVNNSK
ncbi:Ras-specific guanine nucleotide-releasing factor RalGPS1 [Physocladia obscura]|uniref:Ras-specific guanine nucleotide-releasing factor RalGPS1 n=1 Tax=Physocladia obscura TaxID=109957 RepID=A0AAD5SYR7_9FUNG|nr:Ras-specific guanine nucleotide-releasing factor RalGPS1 [Physocladia obscura]